LEKSASQQKYEAQKVEEAEVDEDDVEEENEKSSDNKVEKSESEDQSVDDTASKGEKISHFDTSESEHSSEENSKPGASTSDLEDEDEDDDDDEDAMDADALFDGNTPQNIENQIKSNKDTIKWREKQSVRDQLKKNRDGFLEDEDDTVPWFKERECILLLLEARLMLRDLVAMKLKEERMRSGALSVVEIQNLLQSQQEEQQTDWITEIQELKRNLVSEIRRNHVLERELNKLDKRIALLIKNRGNIQEVLAAHVSKKSKQTTEAKNELLSDPRRMEHYQNLFYLLQTEPKYLASLVYLMNNEQMDSFLDTVILTLYGDAFSPREEFLILKLFQAAIQREMNAIKDVSDFLKADSVVPRMVVTYNRRKQGLEFLKTVLAPILKSVMTKEFNLELKPAVIYQTMISEQEVTTGQKSTLKRNLTEDKIMELKEIKAIVNTRVQQLQQICQQFLDGIVGNMNKLPYGIRWICKQICTISQQNFAKCGEDDVLKVTGYFVYYRFINLAIVTPDAFEIVDKELSPVARKNLVSVSKVLQNLFNFSLFGGSDKWMMPLNDWIKKNIPIVRDYFTDLIEVSEPEDFLQVDKYMELTQKTKPVIIISLHEIAQTHSFLLQNIDKLAKDKEDPLRLILTDLGDAPQVPKEDDREIQLTLTNRFKQNMEEEISVSANLYAETKELIINAFRSIPVQSNDQDQSLIGILTYGKSNAKTKGDTQLIEQIDKILDNIKSLETEGFITKSDNYGGFLRDIALEVANRAEIREQQRKEIKRLNQTLRNLRKHQKYLNDQIQQYNNYLQDCRLKHYQSKTKKKKKTKEGENPNKMGPIKFAYSSLAKQGVIIDSEVPAIMRKKCTFYISSEAVGVFDIVAKIAGKPVEKMTLELDDLLERNYNNITRLELDQVTLDVNMTIHLINKFFLK